MTREPTRGRTLMIIGSLLGAVMGASVVWADSQPLESWWFEAVMAGHFLLVFGTLAVAVITGAGTLFVDPLSRPARFDVRAGAFRMEQLVSPGFTAMLELTVYGFLLGRWTSDLPRFSHPDTDFRLALPSAVISTVLMGALTIVTLVMVVVTWTGGPIYELTTAGIHSRSMFASLLIPWEALYTDGPPRPSADTISRSLLYLAAEKPELVRYRGIFRYRSPEYPVVPLAVKTHPWLLTDAIRWYAQHPEHRAGIGTHEEHDRLISTVTADHPRLDVVRPPRPKLVSAAAWVAAAGASASALLAAANLPMAAALLERIAEDGGPIAARIWFGLVLAGVVLTLLAARGVRQASRRARFGLLVLSGLVVLAGCLGAGLGSASLSVLDVPGKESLGITLWMAHQSLAFMTGIAVIVLLQLPTSRRYFKRFLPDPV